MTTYQPTADELILLSLIRDLGDEANWYRVGRTALGRLSTPASFTAGLTSLLRAGLLEEEVSGDGTPARIWLTPNGMTALGAS